MFPGTTQMRVFASCAHGRGLQRAATPESPGRRRTSPGRTAGRGPHAAASTSAASRRRRSSGERTNCSTEALDRGRQLGHHLLSGPVRIDRRRHRGELLGDLDRHLGRRRTVTTMRHRDRQDAVLTWPWSHSASRRHGRTPARPRERIHRQTDRQQQEHVEQQSSYQRPSGQEPPSPGGSLRNTGG